MSRAVERINVFDALVQGEMGTSVRFLGEVDEPGVRLAITGRGHELIELLKFKNFLAELNKEWKSSGLASKADALEDIYAAQAILSDCREKRRQSLDSVREEFRGKQHNAPFVLFHGADTELNQLTSKVLSGDFKEVKKDLTAIMKNIREADAIAVRLFRECEERRETAEQTAAPAEATTAEQLAGEAPTS